MRKLIKKNALTPEIPTGTFADIAFLLLVFFMLTTVIAITRGIWFKVPEQAPPDEQPPEKNPAIYMFVNEAGSLIVQLAQAGEEKGNFRSRLSGALDAMQRYQAQKKKSEIMALEDQRQFLQCFSENIGKENPRNVGMV